MFTYPTGFIGAAAGGAAYDPGMMTFDGSTGYYDKTSITYSGNKVTLVCRFKRAAFTGGSVERICNITGTNVRSRVSVILYASDHATVDRRSKISVRSANSAGTNICLLWTDTAVVDDAEHVLFYSYDADAGTAILYIDGVDADDTGNAERVAPSVGTIEAGTGDAFVGAVSASAQLYSGELGYFGYDDQYLTNPTDFYHPTNGLQELDETTWTEWGSQPKIWQDEADLSVENLGSLTLFTKNGTITGPA